MTVLIGSNELKTPLLGATTLKQIRAGDKKVFPKWYVPNSNTLIYLPLNWDLKDYWQNGYNGTWSNITYTELSSWQKVATFNWSSSRITTPNIGTLANDRTFLYFIFAVDCANYPSCITKWSAAASRNLLQLWFIYSWDGNYPRWPTIWFYGDDYKVGSSIPLSTRLFMAYTYEYSTRTRKIYQNGTLLGSNVAEGQYSLWSGGLYIWSWPYSVSWWDASYQWLNGRMSNIIWENKVRSQSEIQELFNDLKSLYWIS